MWDLWSLIGKDYDAARKSVERRIAIITERLDELASRWGSSELKVILTHTVDVPFQPSNMRATNSRTRCDLWNIGICSYVKQRKNGNMVLYLFDMNALVMIRIRDYQLYMAGIEEEIGLD